MIYHYLNQKPSFDKPDCLHTFLLWFASPNTWKSKLKPKKSTHPPKPSNINHVLPNPHSNPHSIYLFHRPITIHPTTKKIHAMSSLFHYSTYEYGLYPDILPKDKEIFEEFQAHIFHVNNIDQPYPIPYDGKWNFYPITYLWDLDEDMDFHRQNQKLPHHAHPAGYSQDNEDSTMDIDETSNNLKINSPSQGPSGYSASYTSPDPQAINNHLEDYTCPDNGYGCCEEHMLEFEMDH